MPKISHLSELKTVEVSLVPRGALKKDFLILKEDGEMPKLSPEKIQELIAKTKLKGTSKITKILEDGTLEESEKEAVLAALRILSAVGLDADTLGKIQAAAGLEVESEKAQDEEELEKAKESLKEKEEELEKAEDELEKAEGVIKSLKKKLGDDEPDYDYPVTKSGELDIDRVPKSTRKLVQKLWEQDQAHKKIKKQLDDERDIRITKEYVEKAEEFSSLPVKKDELGGILKTVALSDPKTYEKLEGILKATNEAVKKGGLLSVVGSDRGSNPSLKNMDEITKRAVMVSKEAGLDLNESAAVTHFITKTAEGRKAYSEYRKKGA